MTSTSTNPNNRKKKQSFLGQLGLEDTGDTPEPSTPVSDSPPAPAPAPAASPPTPSDMSTTPPPSASVSVASQATAEVARHLRSTPVSTSKADMNRSVPPVSAQTAVEREQVASGGSIPSVTPETPAPVSNSSSPAAASRTDTELSPSRKSSPPVYSAWSDRKEGNAPATDVAQVPESSISSQHVRESIATPSSNPIASPEPNMISDQSKPKETKRSGFHLPAIGIGNTEERDLYERGLTTLHDLISPPAIRVSPNTFQIGDVYARTLYVVAYPKYLGTNWFSPIINIDSPMDIGFLIHPVDTREVMKDLRRSATHVQSQISLESEGGKIRDPMLESALENIEELRDRLQQGTEKFFRFGLYITVYAGDERALSDISNSIEAILEAQLVFTKRAILRMDQGFVSTRPLGMDTLDVANNLNTSPLSTTFPFVSSDLSSNDGILYGINRHNNSLVLFDRFKMENANMVVFAKSGAGKSYAVKLEILRSMMFGTSIIVIDPENEYKHLCETVGGTFVGISLASDAHINPFDLPRTRGDESEEGLFRSHIASLIGLLHIMLGAMTAEEDSILDRAIRETYAIRDITERSDFRALDASSFPTMTDLYEVLRNIEGAESLAARLEQYTEGVFSGFLNHQTNVSTSRQMVVFNIRDLEPELRPIAMYVILQHIWNEIRSEMKQRMIVVDEAWIMMQNEDAAAFMFGIAKRCRKYYAGLTTITQDVGDFMASRYGKPIVTNSSIQLLLRQSPAAVDLIADLFYLTDHEKFLLLESNVGEGIFFAGTKHVAIKIVASYSEDQVITSDPRQLLEIEEAKREFDAEAGL